jgi:hypothetical protein
MFLFYGIRLKLFRPGAEIPDIQSYFKPRADRGFFCWVFSIDDRLPLVGRSGGGLQAWASLFLPGLNRSRSRK